MKHFRGSPPVQTDEKRPDEYLPLWEPYDYLCIQFDGTKEKGGKTTDIYLHIGEEDVKALFLALIKRCEHRLPTWSLDLCADTLTELARACHTSLEQLLQANERNDLERKELRKKPKARRE